jgi:hypothetical protein
MMRRRRDDWQGREGKGRLLGGRLEFLGPGKHHQVVAKGITLHPSFIPCSLFTSIPFHESGPSKQSPTFSFEFVPIPGP